ncbi:hypothetical protein HYX14_04075 [Candidatus Woesearchaeota archaeon]|nr:hypothetical protein [Candidatus Woesearchaeota archaeon]
MAKKCMICDAPAVFQIKNTTDYYCADCAEENFGDVSVLVKVEEEAQRLKKLVDEKMEEENNYDESNN